jgi:hypothetical protein
MSKKKTSRQTAVRHDDLQQEIGFDELIDLCNEVWREEITSESPDWGHALGLHVRLSELQHLAEAAQDLLP